MSRTIMDGDFHKWEVFVNTGDSGFSRPPRIVFRCLSDRGVTSRIAPFQGEPNEALTFVASGGKDELLALLGEGTALS